MARNTNARTLKDTPYKRLNSVFRNIVYLARKKLDEELDASDTNRFLFNKVCSLETLSPVSAIFDPKLIRERAYFEFELEHVESKEWFPLMVEAFLLADEERVPEINGSLVLCTLEEPGRGMLFPAFRYKDLQVHSMSAPFKSAENINRFISLENSAGTKITLRCPDEGQFQFWRQQLENLFPQDVEQPSITEVNNEDTSMSVDTMSTHTSYSFGSKCEDICQPFHGLNIVSNSTSTSFITVPERRSVCEPPRTEQSIFELPRLSFSNYSLSPQLDLFSSTPSLIEEPELKAFLAEDFDFTEYKRGENRRRERPLSTLEVTFTPLVEDLDIVSLSDASDVSGPDYTYDRQGPLFVISGDDDESISSISTAEGKSALPDTVLDGVEPQHNYAKIPEEVLIPPAVLPMRFPPCPPTPTASVTSLQESFTASKPISTDLPALDNKSEASSHVVSQAPLEVTNKFSLTPKIVEHTQLPTPSPTLKRKASTSKRFVSVLKKFSVKLKTKTSSTPFEGDSDNDGFEMIDTTTPRQQQEAQFESTRQVQFTPTPMHTIDRGNPFRAGRALSKISEEVFFDEDFDEDEEDEFDTSMEELSEPLVARDFSNNSLNATSAYVTPHQYSVDSPGPIGTAVDSESNNETVQQGHARLLSNGVSVISLRRDTSNGSLDSAGSRTSFRGPAMAARKSLSGTTLAESKHRKSMSSASARSTVSIMRVSTAMVSRWQGPNWIPVSDTPLSLTVGVSNVGSNNSNNSNSSSGIIRCHLLLSSQDSLNTIYEEGMVASRPILELPLDASTHVRKCSTFDVHVRQGSEVYLFRLRNAAVALEFSQKVAMARYNQVGSGGRINNITPAPPMSRSFSSFSSSRSASSRSVSSRSSTGSIGNFSLVSPTSHLTPLIVPPLLSPHSTGPVSPTTNAHTGSMPNSPQSPTSRLNKLMASPNTSKSSLSSLASSSTSTIKTVQSSSPGSALLVSNIRCRIFSQSSSPAVLGEVSENGSTNNADNNCTLRWVESGIARLRVYEVPKQATMRRLTLIKPASNDALVDARLPSTCFAKAGPVGLSISDVGASEPKYLLRMRNSAERDLVANALAQVL